MSKKTGIVIIKVDGFVLEAALGVKYNFGNPERAEVFGNGKVSGFYETPKPSMVSCTIQHDALFDIKKITSWDNVTLVVRPDAGPSYQIDGAFLSNTLELSDQGGGIPLEFKGPPAEVL